MKGFIGGVCLVIVVSVIAWAALDTFDMSAADAYSSPQSVRLR
jgi:hypothetical protein